MAIWRRIPGPILTADIDAAPRTSVVGSSSNCGFKSHTASHATELRSDGSFPPESVALVRRGWVLTVLSTARLILADFGMAD
jgi:hypothetical protein